MMLRQVNGAGRGWLVYWLSSLWSQKEDCYSKYYVRCMVLKRLRRICRHLEDGTNPTVRSYAMSRDGQNHIYIHRMYKPLTHTGATKQGPGDVGPVGPVS
jgi:hypothetical protein